MFIEFGMVTSRANLVGEAPVVGRVGGGGAVAVRIGSVELVLLAQRAVLWERTLFVADLHVGKPAAFGHHGIPVPIATVDADLIRLSELVAATKAQHVIVLGDLLHDATGRDAATMGRVAAWRAEQMTLRMTLVRGNHDKRAGDPPGDWRIECVSEGERLGPFTLLHRPPENVEAEQDGPGPVSLFGHVHPVVVMQGPARMSERSACFVCGPRTVLLPAFGSFTGGKAIMPLASERVFAIGDGSVMEVPGRLMGGRRGR